MSELAKQADKANSVLRIGWIAAAVVFGGMLLWSFLAPIDSAAIAPGQISVENSRKVVQHLDGGVVSEIMVKEGDRVSEGDILVKLDRTAALANERVLSEQLAEGIARYARALAERDGLAEIPVDSLAFKMAPDGIDFKRNLEGQKSLLAASIDTRNTQIRLLKERVLQQQKRIEGLRQQHKSLVAQARLIEDELVGVKKLNAEGYAPMTRVRELERGRENIAGQQGQVAAAIAESESVISSARIEIEGRDQQARLDAAREAQDLQLEIAGLIERSIAARSILSRTEIRASESGRVLALKLHTIGGVIAPGAPLMEIVPENSGLVVTARLSPLDVDKVHAGQSAIIRFSALDARLTPEVDGVVRQVSADNIMDETTGATFYLVYIDLPSQESLEPILRGQKLVPGMPVESLIRTGSRPAISYLLKPLTDAFAGAMRES